VRRQLAIGAVFVLVASVPQTAMAAPPRAMSAADALVAGRPAALHPGADDAYTRKATLSADGWQYVPYERTYRGLPVIGGDFVVVVDPSGKVNTTSVAQKTTIAGLDVHPKVTQAAALAVAGGVGNSRLVVDATSGTARLAWEVGTTARTVFVDAVTGTIFRTKATVLDDVGQAGLNGGLVNVADTLMNCPVLGECPDQHTWILAYPSGGGLSCDAPEVHRTDPEPLDWGNGDPTNNETACVDAMFVSDTENAMLKNWLGRSGGLRGLSPVSGFPISTDTSLVNNSYYVPDTFFSQPEVHIGHSPNGVWWASLDVVGHENGHGVDDHTPGGISGGGTPEFIADAFGVSTEWYANEHPQYDTPDYVLGDTAAMALPDGAKRYMYDPARNEAGVNCYSSTITSLDDHEAAGVGDHWFYLLAEGSNPTDGQPVSPTCNGGAVGGIGIQATMKILYNAMLMKNSNSSYLTYRSWTLTAAKNQYPGNCGVIDSVRKAWDAVGVPAQSGEPDICVPGVTGVAQSTAQSTLAANGLATGSVTSQASLSPAGSVIGQSPGAGTIVTFGTAVSLTVSAGGVQVPNVLSFGKTDAINILQGAGLSVSTSSQKACIDPNGVLTESPSGGSVVLPGSTVHLTIDSGTIKSCGVIK
jgi:hypothetical protein